MLILSCVKVARVFTQDGDAISHERSTRSTSNNESYYGICSCGYQGPARARSQVGRAEALNDVALHWQNDNLDPGTWNSSNTTYRGGIFAAVRLRTGQVTKLHLLGPWAGRLNP